VVFVCWETVLLSETSPISFRFNSVYDNRTGGSYYPSSRMGGVFTKRITDAAEVAIEDDL